MRGNGRFGVLVVGAMAFLSQVAAGVHAATAGAAGIECGAIVQADLVLDHDLGPCPGNGLNVVSTTGVTVDLNGHRIVGTGDIHNPAVGIRVASAGRITLRNGTVTRFALGIELNTVRDSLVTGLDVVDNTGAIGEAGGASHSGAGILLFFARDNVIRGSQVRHNGPTAGIRIITSGGNRIEDNRVVGNDVRSVVDPHTFGVTQLDAGIKIEGDVVPPRGEAHSGANTVRNNLISGNGWHGIALSFLTSDNVVTGNTIVGNGLDQPADLRVFPYGSGVRITAPANTVAGNLVSGNGGHGIAVSQPGNTIRGNQVVLNAQRPNLLPGYDLFDELTGCPNTWSQNRFRTFNQPCVTG